MLGFVIEIKESVELTFVTVPEPPPPPVVISAVVPLIVKVPLETTILFMGLPDGFPSVSVIHNGGLIGPLILSLRLLS